MLSCKRCGSKNYIKNGIVLNKQRYHCKDCQYNFREGDGRANEKIAAKKALCILLDGMAKGSFRMLGRIFDVPHTLVYRWIRSVRVVLSGTTVIRGTTWDVSLAKRKWSRSASRWSIIPYGFGTPLQQWYIENLCVEYKRWHRHENDWCLTWVGNDRLH